MKAKLRNTVRFLYLAIGFIFLTATSCTKDDLEEPVVPPIKNLEIQDVDNPLERPVPNKLHN